MTTKDDDTPSGALMSRDRAAVLERVVVGGDLSKLTPQERMTYYAAVCQSVGLNPMTRPFEYMFFQNKMTLYARKDATEQLRRIHGVSIDKMETTLLASDNEELYQVTAYAHDSTGRRDTATGVVALGGSRGEAKANAMMRAETKAKRRVTLSLCGLGILDESELDVTPAAVTVTQTVPGETLPVRGPGGGGYDIKTREEQSILFMEPEADRARLAQRARIAVARIEKDKVAALKQEHLGSAEAKYEEVDLAALVAFVQAVEVPL